MNHARSQMRACAQLWRLYRSPLALAGAVLWRERSRGRISIPVTPFEAPCFLVPVPGANLGRRA